MQSSRSHSSFLATVTFPVICLVLACAPVAEPVRISPTPVAYRWPDPAFLPERQCRGTYAVDQLDRFRSRARLALWLPGTRSVSVDQQRRCLTVTVSGVGDGRLAELVLRGVGIPRRAVLLLLAERTDRVRSSTGPLGFEPRIG
jgi:hypothetical protein